MNQKHLLVLVPMLAGTVYHIGQKTLKTVINPFLVFFIAYSLGAIFMLVSYMASSNSMQLKIPELDTKAMASLGLITLGFIGIEMGFLFVYRSGLEISKTSFVTSLGTSLLLLIFGIFVLGESISAKQGFGIGFAVLSIYLLMK